ncbi:hypothetical protein SLEP1_g45555 [Rubroshorea leprosula]|uniref:Reverse transcriptase Ty1/copia-type domain-containing protein n=1 Tax=Rubroshorea leprosula TaxID=152421 RepID=A0AAV5LL17_9ROSI|nr:hypothetical protein SLEP1_g45555 [Rubroshorea leprosula]
MQEELDALKKKNTWELVPCPPGANIVRSKWVFKTKLNQDGSIERFKARLVAKGFSQVPGLDFDETFSPVLKPTTLRLVIALATTQSWPLRQLDVKNAFLHGMLKETMYMTQPLGFVDPQYLEYVCCLHCSIYGLKQAPRAWFDSTDELLQQIISNLSEEFALKDLRPLHYFLGIEGTSQYGIRYLEHSPLSLTGFCDADWAGCPLTRCSTTGFCIFLGANCVSWGSKKQPTVARSTAEAEYRALASTTAELMWITFLLRDVAISLHSPPQLFSDNISALHMSINPVFHARTKHIEIDYHFVREKVAIGSLITCYISGIDQLADLLTKPLLKHRYQLLRSKLGVFSSPLSNLRGSMKTITANHEHHGEQKGKLDNQKGKRQVYDQQGKNKEAEITNQEQRIQKSNMKASNGQEIAKSKLLIE